MSGDGDDRMRVGALSVVVDGGLGWTLEPYRGRGLSHPLLKFSGGSVDDYATIPDDSSSPS